MGNDDERTRPADGGSGLPPELTDGTSVDEGPMRRELMRQIKAVELEMARFKADNCPYERIVTSPVRGPAMLSTAELEQVRDELLAARGELHDRVVRREAADLETLRRTRLVDRLKRALRVR